jgi:hypothetical protein
LQAGTGGFMKNHVSARRNGFIKIQIFFSGGNPPRRKKLSAKQAIIKAEALVVPPLVLSIYVKVVDCRQ